MYSFVQVVISQNELKLLGRVEKMNNINSTAIEGKKSHVLISDVSGLQLYVCHHNSQG